MMLPVSLKVPFLKSAAQSIDLIVLFKISNAVSFPQELNTTNADTNDSCFIPIIHFAFQILS